jgi:hypothetical protein
MTLVELYQNTASVYGKHFNEAQFSAWESVLGGFPIADIKNAIEEWFKKQNRDFDGRPCGSRMPSAAELYEIVTSHRRVNEVSGEGCGRCSNRWVRVFSGETAGWDDQTKGPLGEIKRAKVDRKIGAMVRCKCFYQRASKVAK